MAGAFFYQHKVIEHRFEVKVKEFQLYRDFFLFNVRYVVYRWWQKIKVCEIWQFLNQKLPFLPQNPQISFLKSKNGVLEILLKSHILCTKILGTGKFFLKSKNFLKSNMLKSKIHCISSKVEFISSSLEEFTAWQLALEFYWPLESMIIDSLFFIRKFVIEPWPIWQDLKLADRSGLKIPY